MPDNLISTSADDDHAEGTPPRTGQTLRLGSLAPKFDPPRHQLYFDLLERAIAHGGSRNIALTGAYGTGKSSVLQHLKEHPRYREKTVTLALSTIAPRSTFDGDETASSPPSQVNLIQKEIVKQLLYRTAVAEVPRTRFHRASVPPRFRGLRSALVIGLSIALVLFALGPLHPLITSWFDGWWRHALAYIVATALLVGATWLAVRIVRSRPLMSASVNAAITTVTLAKKSDTYFDAYLDEIVYFFEATGTTLVLIEDIDRFEDAEIFDTLRALNNLLNESHQLNRRIVFVYAIRDSVFEKIGADAPEREGSTQLSDRAKEALKRASRTKFFDVVIPVVPFISPDNARDVMSKAMKSPDFKIKPALIRLAARHVADMRMIHNVRNEFEVYRQELVVAKRALPDINDNLVFAIVLFKNTHLADYESIRHRDSSLDHLYVSWRALVARAIPLATRRLTEYRTATRPAPTAEEQARALGLRLHALRDVLNDSAPGTFTVSLAPEIDDAITTPSGWASVAEDGEVVLSLNRNNGTSTAFAISTESLTRLLGAPVNPADWATRDTKLAAAQERQLVETVALLRHHTWAQLHTRQDLTIPADELDLTDEEDARLRAILGQRTEASFADLVSAILPSEMSRELVRHGYITSHFALYASNYYGKHLSKAAREYIYRCISPGVPDTNYPLTKRDIQHILREQKADKNDRADLFNDASVLNIDFVDYLLRERPVAASLVGRQLGKMGDAKFEFLDAYMSQGASPGALLATMVPHWREATHYAATASAVADDSRLAVLDAVLAEIQDDSQASSASVAAIIAEHYRRLTSFTSPSSTAHAAFVIGLLDGHGNQIPDLTPLSADSRDAVLSLGMFPVTLVNLRAFVPSGNVDLGALRQTNRDLYNHILQNIADYAHLTQSKSQSVTMVENVSQLVTLIRDVQAVDREKLSVVFDATLPMQVPELSVFEIDAWPEIVAAQRVVPSAVNVAAYVEQYGVDQHLAKLLKPRKILDPAKLDPATRVDLAHAILRARDVISSTLARVRTVSTLDTGKLEASALTPESGDLVARLLAARLLEDDASAFGSALMVDWVTLERTIKVSKQFAAFVVPAILPSRWIASFLRSTVPTQKARTAVVTGLPAFLSGATRAEARGIASVLLAQEWRLRPARISGLQQAGALREQVVALMANSETLVDLDDARQILLALGGDYARVASGGSGRPHFPHDAPHRAVIERFVGTTVKHVREETFKRLGLRYVARLQ
ncbi:YobI family P-loop NTPase [Microbacterium aerolatum]|uniref:Putative membrane protein YobI n=1 Tax=Microbacterium aerolatum TaxID=153731 RepID=A0A511AAG0_9MICO|nr:hypothetical protein [Microbacterium aerolatum]GEK85170.1 putative membrane protein YobI [Microbacterium aerolatum]GGB28991.1 putative membrane protein YobI [Microbacterium aerolatum]